MLKSLFVVAMVLGSVSVADARKLTRPASAYRVIDGDTIVVNRANGPRVRLIGYDAPEIHKNRLTGYKCEAERTVGLAAKDALQMMLAPPRRVGIWYLRTAKGKLILDKYGRRLAVVRSNGHDVAASMIAAGLGKPYDGTHRPGWCS